MIRADSTAPVFNDEEKRARATTQVHKVARDGYRCDPAGLAFWAGCDGSTTRVAGARHVGSFPHGMCQLSHKRFAPSCGASGPVVRPKSWEAIPFVSLGGLHTVLPGGRGLHSVRNQTRDRCPVIRVSPQVGNSWVGWVQSLSRPAPGPPPVSRNSGQKMPSKNEG